MCEGKMLYWVISPQVALFAVGAERFGLSLDLVAILCGLIYFLAWESNNNTWY
jgi:hypothetical protein